MTGIATTPQVHKSAAPFTPDQESIARYLGLNPQDPKSHAAMVVCDRYKLDPILKHVIVLPKGGVYVTRDGLLHVAHMSGQLDGIVLEEQGETQTEWWAEVSVYRKDMRFPFKFRGRYSKQGGNKAYGPEMALKCAEALALRRAFDISGLPVLEERDAAPAAPVHPTPAARAWAPGPDDQPPPVDPETGEILNDDQAPKELPGVFAHAEPGTFRTPAALPATTKQLTFIANLAKQLGMSPVQLRDDINMWLRDTTPPMLTGDEKVERADQLTGPQASYVISLLKAQTVDPR